MTSSDHQEIVVCNVRVQVDCPALNFNGICRTWGLSDDCLFVEDLPSLPKNTPVDVEFTSPFGTSMRIAFTAGESVGETAFLRFPPMNPEQRSQVEALVWPDWDRQGLLEGVVILSRHFSATELSGWLRLTKFAAWYRRGTIGGGGRKNDG